MKSEIQSEQLMDKSQIKDVIQRIAKEITEDIKPIDEGIMVGIRSRGGDLAKRIAKEIQRITHFNIPIGYIDTTLYRDDIASSGPKPVLQKTEIPFPITNKRIILVDDVLYTGRTIRAALDALIDFGRPKCIRLAVLIDRGHRELPIYPDYVGKKLDLPIAKSVKVSLVEENGEEDQVMILPFPEKVSW